MKAVEFFLVYDRLQPLEHFLVGEFGKSHDGAAGLNWLDQFRAIVASQSESRGVRVVCHNHSESLLSALSHGIGLVQNNELMHAWWDSDFLMRKLFDFLSDDINASIIGSIEL